MTGVNLGLFSVLFLFPLLPLLLIIITAIKGAVAGVPCVSVVFVDEAAQVLALDMCVIPTS